MKKLIHQIWIGPKTPPINWMMTWVKHNPEYEYKFWDENSLKELKFVNQKQIDWSQEWSAKSDIMQYEILHRYGGIFVDADLECVRPLEDYLLEHDAFSVWEHELIRPGLINTAILACEPKSPLLEEMVSGINKMSQDEVYLGLFMGWKAVGPQYLTDTVNRLKYRNLTVFPSCFFMPYHYRPEWDYHGAFKPFAIHYWGSTPDGSTKNY